MRSTLGGAVALLASTALATAGLTTGAATAAPVDPTKPARVLVSIDAKRVVTAPRTIRPGLNAFAVSSARADDSQLQLVTPDEGYTRTDFLLDYRRAFTNGSLVALGRLQDRLTFLGGTDAYQGFNGTAKVDVAPGAKIWAFDFYAGTMTAAKMATVQVAGEPANDLPVTGDATITADGPSSWADAPASIPSSGNVVFDNASGDNADLEIYKLKKGATVADFAEWVDNGGNTEPPLNFRFYTFSGVQSDGESTSLRYSLPVGDYVVLSAWLDDDGVPQLSSGMFRGITLGSTPGRAAAPAPARTTTPDTPFTRWVTARR